MAGETVRLAQAVFRTEIGWADMTSRTTVFIVIQPRLTRCLFLLSASAKVRPAGAAIDAKGGRDSFYAVDYAARTASERGADLVKVNFPQPGKQSGVPEPYRREVSPQDAIDAVVRSANRTLLLVSGGEHAGDEAMLEKTRHSMEAGATGLIFGRNIFQRSHDDSLRLVARLQEILAKYPS